MHRCFLLRPLRLMWKCPLREKAPSWAGASRMLTMGSNTLLSLIVWRELTS